MWSWLCSRRGPSSVAGTEPSPELSPGEAVQSRARALPKHLSQSFPACPWPPYLASCSTRRGQTRFLFSFISISNMMSQREMICKRKEQKEVCVRRVFGGLERRQEEAATGAGEILGGRSGAQPGVAGGSTDHSKPFCFQSRPGHPRGSWEGELGSRVVLGLLQISCACPGEGNVGGRGSERHCWGCRPHT